MVAGGTVSIRLPKGTFKGHAKEKFIHHGSDIDDGGFKLIVFVRLTNSWMRRVNFESGSEAMSITTSANCSAYDITIGGNRGHASIRSQASSRIFIGKVHNLQKKLCTRSSATSLSLTKE